MPPIIRRILPATRILAPLTMLAGLLMLMTSPAGAVDLTSPGKTLADAPAEAITQAAGVQPAAQDPGTPTDSTPACATVGDETDPIKCLPIIRWATSMQMSDTVAFNISQPMRSVEVTTLEKTSFEGLLTGGNMVWMVAALIINAVTNYQVNAQMVKPLNDFAAAFGSSIIDSGAIYLILGLAVVAMATAGVRAGFTVRRFAMMILSLGIFAAMVMGSMNDRGEGASYDPGFFSPAWMVQEVSGGFSAIADALATPISNRSADATTVFSDEAKNDPTSCKSYIDTLHDQYNQYYEDTGQPAPAALDVMSRWWEETAYRAFATVQYGDASDLGADYAACQQLETNAGVTNHDRHEILTAAYSSGDEDYSAVVPVAGSPMITGGHTNDNRAARQNLAWGLCQVDTEGNYTLRSDLPEEGIAGGKIGGPLTQDACTAMFTGDGVNHDPRFVFSLPFSDKVSPDSTVAELDDIQFAVVGDKSLLSDPDNELASHPQAYGFVANSAGTIRTASTLLTISYLVSALCGGVAMALLAGVLFVMKLLSYAMAFFLILAALAGVVSQGFGSASSFFKGWIGYTAITSMTTLLFAFVLLMASGLLRAGDSIFGQWALAMMIWIGLCPALSILVLNWAFKRLFRTSSPFTLRGMQAMAGNPAAVAGATAAGGSLLKNGMDKGSRQLKSSLVSAGKNRLGGKAGADSKSPAAGEELLGDAENPAPADKQVAAGSKDAVDSSTKQAVTSGAGEGQDGQADGEDRSEGTVVGAANGDADTAAVEDGSSTEGDVAVDEGFDDSMVAGAVDAPAEDGAGHAGSRSLGQRLSDFDASGRRDENLDRAAGNIEATAAAVGAGALRTGREGRLAAGRARDIPANLRRQITGGAGMIKQKWDKGKATRASLWNDPGLAAEYLATRGTGKAAQVVGTAGTKLAAAAKNPATYTKAMKGAALYGGMALASGGLAVPAAVMGGRSLIKHRQRITGGASHAARTGAGALTGLAKSSYRAGVPEMSREDRQEAIQSMELNSRIRADQSADDKAPITELAQGLPMVQERQLAAEMADATESFDAFEAENGRAPEASEKAAMVEDLPFYSSMNADTELRDLFEHRVAEQTKQASSIFDAYQASHGEQMSAEQMRSETAHLPFYAQSVRGLDPRQGSLSLAGTGNHEAPRLAGPDPRTFDPHDAPEPEATPVPDTQGTIDLDAGGAGQDGPDHGG
ncbi:MAG: hypothetical protein L0H93_04340 [Nocardioides sp.]|nr:hypothetical protein [Nocardioides sp.]